LGLIKAWKVRGKRGNYPVLINHFPVHDKTGRELRVNAEKTTDWRRPFLEEVSEDDREMTGICPPSDRNMASVQEVRSKNEEDNFAFEGKHLRLTGKEQSALREGFAGIDVDGVLRRADAWCVINPGRAPRRNHAKFAFDWLSREKPGRRSCEMTEEELREDAKQKERENVRDERANVA
jgi:hypothetical protein